ncbi:hypothetical protein COLO4_32835 [Corchorus olitorius]|uniref:Uncharacterized protein n=1 Tax=Corchorus olitorius TaxID=93759 RepID=A0A1R3GXT1_9ROSI|nr:hypothetical protein COLO4_32835 [Corchorus olitorius]
MTGPFDQSLIPILLATVTVDRAKPSTILFLLLSPTNPAYLISRLNSLTPES